MALQLMKIEMLRDKWIKEIAFIQKNEFIFTRAI